MYKVLIVDDETTIRNGIAKSIPWGRLGFEVAGLCENGRQALESVREEQPDVVLTDIRMPEMDGIELMRELNTAFPSVVIVILSGFSDFEYLKMSIKSGAVDYLLKPTDIDEFQAVFIKIKNRLDTEREQKKAYSTMLSENEQGRWQRYAKWLEELVRGYVEDDCSQTVRNELECRLGLYLDNCFVIQLLPDNLPVDDLGMLHKMLESVVGAGNTHPEQGSFLFVTHEETIVCIYSMPTDQPLDEEDVDAFIERLSGKIYRLQNIAISAGISTLCTEPDVLPLCYEQAKCSARQKTFLGAKQIFHYSQFGTDKRQKIDYIDMNELEPALLSGDCERVKSEIERLFLHFENKALENYEFVDYTAMEAMLRLARWAVEYNVDTDAVLRSLGMKYSDIFRCDSLAMKKQFVNIFFYAMQREIEQGRRKGGFSVAGRVRECMDAEYANNAISLEYVAEKIHKSPVYVSKVFKHELGCNFSEYLMKKRIEKAQELLRNPLLKVYEISEMVGYVNPSNFIKVFRKYKGVSPNEFRAITYNTNRTQ